MNKIKYLIRELWHQDNRRTKGLQDFTKKDYKGLNKLITIINKKEIFKEFDTNDLEIRYSKEYNRVFFENSNLTKLLLNNTELSIIWLTHLDIKICINNQLKLCDYLSLSFLKNIILKIKKNNISKKYKVIQEVLHAKEMLIRDNCLYLDLATSRDETLSPDIFIDNKEYNMSNHKQKKYIYENFL